MSPGTPPMVGGDDLQIQTLRGQLAKLNPSWAPIIADCPNGDIPGIHHACIAAGANALALSCMNQRLSALEDK